MAQQQKLVADLKSSRETAKNSLNEIYAKISKCKDNAKTKSAFAYNAVHAICMAIKDNGTFYEIYNEAIDRLVENISEYHWNMFVELLRFILGEFYSKNLFKQSVCLAVLARADRIATPDDVKSHLKLYSRQLFYAHTHMSDNEIKDVFKSITELLSKSKELQSDDLIFDFQSQFLGFPSMLQSVIVKHLDKAAAMFEMFFVTIGAFKIQENKVNESMITLTKLLVNFIHLDVADQNTVFSQNFLRSCKENASVKGHKYQNYAINLLYYFVKLLLFPNAPDFNRNFLEVIAKFSTFVDRSELAREPWFMDTIVTMTRIFDAFKGQKALLQAMSQESHQEVFSLIEKLIKLAHGVNYESGMWTCCNSVRKHVIFKLCVVELVMFETVVENSFAKPELGAAVYTILKHSIAVAEYFKCSTVNYEVASIMNALMRCAQNVKTKEHGELVVKMLLLTTQVKAYLPENSFKTLSKCIMHVYKNTGDSQRQAEACALYIGHLMESKADSDLIRRYIGVFYSLDPCTSISELLDQSTSPLQSKSFSRRLLHSIEAGVFFKMRDDNILVITSLLKSASTILDFVLIARKYPHINVSAKLDRKYAELKEKCDLTPVEYLALGHICKVRAIHQMDELKNIFNLPKINDESLPKVSDPCKLKLMDISNEMLIMRVAQEGVESFAKFFEFSSHQLIPEPDFSVDWELIIDDVAMLARLFHFRGYVDYAYSSWRLLLRIATHVDDILNKIRALSFICDECLFIELYDPEFSFEDTISSCEQAICECLINMEFLTPRRQNYVLSCLCYIGWYLAHKKRFTESQMMLDLALAKVDELVDRKNKFELLRATHLAVSFRIKWKLQEGLSKTKAFAQVDKILDEIRAVVYYTSEDSLNFPTLLFAVVNDITEFTTNRLCEPATLPYVQMVLNMALDSGAAYRSVQFLALWTHINLQSENVTKCQIKLDLIDILLRNAQPTKPAHKAKEMFKNQLEVGPIEPYRIYGQQTIRKAVYINPVSPVRIKYKVTEVHRNLDDFLITHEPSCTCDKCSHAFLNWQYFKVGCLNARLLYLGEAYNEPNEFYAKAVRWCSNSIHKSHTKFHFREYELTMLTQHINLLRRMGNFKSALTISKDSLDIYNKFKGSLDGVYFVNLSIQSESTKAEMQKKPIKPKHTTRRLLKFSPTDPKPTTAHSKVAGSARKARGKRDSPKTLRENIDDIIYKDSAGTTPAVQKSRAKDGTKSMKSKAKSNTEKVVEEICKTVQQVHLGDDLPKKSTAAVTSTRRRGRPNLNTAVIIIDDDDDDDDDSPPPAVTRKIPKSASKIECTPKARGRPKRETPATIAVTKSGEVEGRSKLLMRRQI